VTGVAQADGDGASGRLDTRIPEPELMTGVAQAAAYAAADFAVAHQTLVDDFVRRFPADLARDGLRILDLGCGPGDFTVRVARAVSGATVVGVDGAAAMLDAADPILAIAGDVASRVTLRQVRLPDAVLAGERWDAVVSNSLLHHLADPAVLWDTVRDCVSPGAPVFVSDLRRPATEEEADALVARHAGDAPEVLRRDFAASLRAAFRPDEVRVQLATAGLDGLVVEVVSDRHLVVSGRR
jgi:2-polyprenyl-3-methyl-5-hydroxy-6-metoxy-1,4-benzoquinol methylase